MENNELLAQIAQIMKAELGSMESRIDDKLGAMESRIDDKLGAMDARIDDKLGAMDARIDDKLGAMSAELRSEMSDMKGDISDLKIEMSDTRKTLSGRIDSLHRSVVIIEDEMPKIQMVLDQQVDIIKELKALQHEKAEHQSIKERLSALEGVTKIYTAKVNKLECDTARSAGPSR